MTIEQEHLLRQLEASVRLATIYTRQLAALGREPKWVPVLTDERWNIDGCDRHVYAPQQVPAATTRQDPTVVDGYGDGLGWIDPEWASLYE